MEAQSIKMNASNDSNATSLSLDMDNAFVLHGISKFVANCMFWNEHRPAW